jgi:tryptophan synthase alpha chain
VTGSQRLASCFEAIRRERRAGLVAYVTAGDPDADRSRDILVTLDVAGADVIEVGVPFSDPLADGPVIQRASERARAGGMTLGGTLDLIARVRDRIAAPLVVFSYANPILRMGVASFARRAREAGVDGVLALDLPIEEAADLRRALAEQNIDTIYLLAPTSTEDRIRRAAADGRGFLYVISRLGVTGTRDALPHGLEELVARIRAHTPLPIAVGFGVSRPEHVREVSRMADAAVVGSALVEIIESRASSADLLARVGAFVTLLKDGARALDA